MSTKDLTYFKFVCELIDAGIWAKMSPAARTLYPVLLRFSDRNFSPVYPGSKKLLELTGFKQKSSLRKARKELVDLGLISITTGTGRKNTIYHFRFDWIHPREAANYPSEDNFSNPQGYIQDSSIVSNSSSSPNPSWQPPYNQIQISINNNPTNNLNPNIKIREPSDLKYNKIDEFSVDNLEELRRQFGSKNVDLAISEAKLAGLPITYANIEKILKSNYYSFISFEKILETLKDKVSENTFKIIKDSFLREENGFLIFSDSLPIYIKNILYKISENILFEPIGHSTNFVFKNSWR